MDFFLFSIFWHATSAAAEIAPLVMHLVNTGLTSRFLEYSETILLPVSSRMEETRLKAILLLSDAPRTDVNAASADVPPGFEDSKIGRNSRQEYAKRRTNLNTRPLPSALINVIPIFVLCVCVC